MLRVSARTVEDWRLDRKGPHFIKMGIGKTARILYPLKEVEIWMQQRLRKL